MERLNLPANPLKTLPPKQGVFFRKKDYSPFLIQPKLSINQPHDVYEQEADAMADKVMRMPDQEHMEQPFFRPSISSLQRKCAHCEEEETMMQRKEVNGKEMTTNDVLEGYVARLNGGGQTLPDDVRNFYEPRFGYDFSKVKVHTDTVAAKSAQSINALAYTSGNHIVFNNNQYSPGTDGGKRLLGHELTHVVQQEPIHHLSSGAIAQRYAICETTENCPTREPGEVGRSRAAPMELFIMSGVANGIMMANFSVESSQIKGDPTSNGNWNSFVSEMASNPHITWEIFGFSDCQGNEGTNTNLRTARATELYLALPDNAKAQVENYGEAPLTECMRNNSTEVNRSLNRSAIIRQKTTSYEFEPETVQGDSSRVVYLCSKPLDTSPLGSHAFFRLDSPTAGNETLSLQPIQVIRAGDCWQGIPAMNYASDQSATGTCERTTIRWADLFREYIAYPIGHYCTLGPNSNTFVGHLARRTGMTDPNPDGWTPGFDDPPPPAGTFAPDKWATLSGCETKECIPDALRNESEPDQA